MWQKAGGDTAGLRSSPKASYISSYYDKMLNTLHGPDA